MVSLDWADVFQAPFAASNKEIVSLLNTKNSKTGLSSVDNAKDSAVTPVKLALDAKASDKVKDSASAALKVLPANEANGDWANAEMPNMAILR
jgi:hypothetical protein